MLASRGLALAAAGSAAATNIYVSSYAGIVKTLGLHQNADQSYRLSPVAVDHNCGSSPSWLTVDDSNSQQTLLCVNEGLTTVNGSLTTYSRQSNGTLQHLDTATTLGGPVNSVVYGTNAKIPRAVALAHYGGSALSTFSIGAGAALSPLQNFTFTLAQAGPVPSRQDAPHPHEAILDPTGAFILVPDLGADEIRIFAIDAATNHLTALAPFAVAPGSGPRHAAFWSPAGPGASSPLFLYVVTELANTLTAYPVTYDSGALTLSPAAFETNTLGGGAVPNGTATAEIHVSPDARFIVVSNRGDNSSSMTGKDGTGQEGSDSLATFAPSSDGSLEFKGLAAAGGSYPRQFSINKAGDLVAVGLQYSHRVVVLPRDVETGEIGSFVAWHHVKGQVTSTMFDE